VALATPVSAAPPIDLPRLDIDYEYAPPLDGRGYWVGDPEGGEWHVVGGGLDRDDRLTLEVVIRPPAISVPLEPGPAVLFGTVGLFGDAGGDVATGASVPRIVTTVLPACPDPTDCVYEGSITLPTDRLPRLAERVRNAEDWVSAVIGLTLVRTFAQGTWLQVLPLYDENRNEPDGRLSRPRHIGSRMLALGAFPVGPPELWSKRQRPVLDRIERLRRSVDDPSGLPATQPLLIDIGTAACTPGWTIATATGDVLVDVTRGGPSAPVQIEAPVGAEWTVSVPHSSRGQGTGYPPRTFRPFSSDMPSLASGWVMGDPYDCEGVESGSIDWRPASSDETASFVASDAADVLATYATLPAEVEPSPDERGVTPAILGLLTSLPSVIWPDAPVPESVAEFMPAAREQLWDQASDGLRLPLHLRFLEARCGSDGGVALVFEEVGPPISVTTYAYTVRDSMPTAPDDGWFGGGTGKPSVLDDPEFIHLMGDDTAPCP
jgi:hypothetical protein